MRDNLQAQIEETKKNTRVITVTSGKGGVGKSNFSVNLAIALTELNQKVILLDADLGLANINVILGISTPYNIAHVIAGEKTISEIMFEGPNGIKIIPGGSGMHELANLKEWQLEIFLTKLSNLDGEADFLIIDTGAGLSKGVLSFSLAADELLIITTPEPTALTDAYGFIKTLKQQRYNGKIKVIVNRVSTETEGTIVFEKLKIATSRFLKYPIEYLGIIRDDIRVVQAVKEQQPFTLAYPFTNATQDIYILASAISKQEYIPETSNSIKTFFTKVAEYFR